MRRALLIAFIAVLFCSAGYAQGTRGVHINEAADLVARSETFMAQDPTGIIMALTAMAVVFLALILLYQVFKQIGTVMIRRSTGRENRHLRAWRAAQDGGASAKSVIGEEIPGEVLAAIGIALSKYEQDLFEMESAVLTINRVARAYSPWSSKIYGISSRLNRK